MENNNFKIVYTGYYDKENHKFMLSSTSKLSFEDLYNGKNEKSKDEKNHEFINETDIKDIKYFYDNPHNITFSFPNNESHEIYIANTRQFLLIIKEITKGKELDIIKSDDGKNFYQSDDISLNYASKYIKYKISSINEEEYNNSNSYVNVKGPLSLKDLSLYYDYYLENTKYVDNANNFYSISKEREEFFEFLDSKLLENKYLPLCGLEGIGKTTSILAYLKCSMKTYFYFNLKTINNLLESNEISKLRDILLKEMYHFIEFDEARDYYDFLNEILEKKFSSIEIFKKIFEKIKNLAEIIVLDQYKTKYDPLYYKLESILNSKYSSKLIIMSSMNEDDVRKSILVSLKWALKLSNIKPKLDYYYIISLVKVSMGDISLLNDDEKKLLEEFGNLYVYYYKIKDFISNNSKYDLNIIFKNEITKEMNTKIQEFYYNSDKKELFQTFINLIMNDEKEYEIKEISRVIDTIPLRYFLLKHENKNIIHFSELKETDTISFNSAFIYVREYFLKYYISTFVNKEINDFKKNNEKNQDSIDLENYFGYFLWAFRTKVQLNGTKIVSYEKVNSMIDLKEDYIESLKKKVENLKDGESILIFQDDQNAKIFDVGILEKKNKKFNLYLVQITTKKNADERITLTGLNDNVNYLNGFFYSKLRVGFGNNYFCYILITMILIMQLLIIAKKII